MVLSEADAELFYEIFFPLLSYVNIKKKVIKGLKAFDRNDHINDTDAHQIAQKLWDDPAIIDRYISDNKDKLNEEKIEILQGFKRAHRGMFFVERILISGFEEFLQDINPDLEHMDEYERDEAEDQKKRMLTWAKSLGWK